MANSWAWTGKYVQIQYSRATLRDVKALSGDVTDRIVELEPRAVAALSAMPGDKISGPVFRRPDGLLWHADPTISGAQLNRAFQEAAQKAGVDRHVFLHMGRHSWASWHYAVNKDLKMLMLNGGWQSLDMADRYSHLVPPRMVPEILTFWGRSCAK